MQKGLMQFSAAGRSILPIVALVSSLAPGTVAQVTSALDGATPPVLAPGQPVGSYALSGFESVNLYGGGLTFHLPVVPLAGNGAPATPLFVNVERRWVMMFDSDNNGYSHYPLDSDFFLSDRRDYAPGTLALRVQGRNVFTNCSEGASVLFREVLTRITFREANGTEHEFVGATSGGFPASYQPTARGDNFPGQYSCFPAASTSNLGRVWVTRDGSFMTLLLESDVTQYGTAASLESDPDVTATLTGYLYTMEGTRYRIEQGLVTNVRDRNGRFTSYVYGTDTNNMASLFRPISITDPIGRTTTITYQNAGASSEETYDVLSFPGSGGTTRTVEVHHCALSPSSPGNCPNYSGPTTQTYAALFEGFGSSSTIYNPRVISYIRLNDGRRYEFSYNSYGELTRVKLPTGGAIEYDHGPGVGTSSMIGYNDGGGSLQIYRRVLERRTLLEDGSLATKTKYKATHGTTCPAGVPYCTKVIEEQQDSSGTVLAATRHHFYGGANDPESFYWHGYYVDYRNGKEMETEHLNMEGQSDSATAPVLRKTVESWEQRTCTGTEVCPSAIGLFPASPVDPRVWKTESILSDSSQTSWITRNFDRFNNVTLLKEYGFSGSQMRETAASFLSTNTVNSATWDYVNIPQGAAPNTFNGNFNMVVHIRNLPEWREVREGTTVVGKTNFYYDGLPLEPASGLTQWDSTVPVARGNLTTEARWLNTSGSTLDTVRRYYEHGGLYRLQDPRNYQSTYTYSCNGTSVASIQNALSQTTNVTTDCSTGAPTGITDPNNVTESRDYSDLLDRVRASYTGSYTRTQFNYYDSERRIEVRKDRNAQSDGEVRTESIYDGLGRTVETREYGPSGVVTRVRTNYDPLGRVWRVSNPFQGASPTDWTVTLYDSLSRVKTVTAPDGAVTSITYLGPSETVTDPSGSSRLTTRDALGRIVSVTEYNGAASYLTAYGYNVLDLLTTVTQGAQTRSFTYDSLSRLITATNPETGLICYGEMVSGSCQARYDENGNLLKKTDGRGVVTTMPPYDPLNRITGKSYSDGTPGVTFTYDTSESITGAPTENKPIGRLTRVANSVSTARYRYDGLGRPLASMQSPASGGSYAFLYTHKPAGPASMTYPSGRVVSWSYDVAGRTVSATGSFGGQAAVYANNITYAPHGAISSMPIENGARTEKWCYNNRTQPVGLRLGTSAAENCDPQSGDLLRLTFGYGTTNNNGNVLSQAIARPSFSASQSYAYDGLNRLRSMTESATAQTYVYDRYGNRAVLSSSYIPIAAQSPVVSSDTEAAVTAIFPSNRWSGGTNDNAGNQIARYGGSFAFDAENRVKSSTVGNVTTAYDYDGEGRRVTKTTSGSTLTFVYDAAGNLAAEYGGTPSATGRQYLTSDHLGSTRLVTNATGGDMKCSDYLPFGEELSQGINGRGTCYAAFADPRQKFTGKERDGETGLDYFGARYHSGAQGRFTGPDPFLPMIEFQPESDNEEDAEEAGQAFNAYIGNPQHWNRYAYALNNPLAFKDEDGRIPIPVIIAAVGAAAASPAGQRAMIAGSTYLQRYAPQLQRIALTSGQAISNAVFTLGPALRDRAVEALSGAPRAFANFPGLDKPLSAQGVATSIKSVDVFAKSYQSGSALFSRLAGYVDQLAGARGGRVGNAVVLPEDIKKRVLKIVVPKGGVQAAQQTLQRVIQYAKKYKDLEIVFKETQ